MRARTARNALPDKPARSMPSTSTDPLVGAKAPYASRNSVVFPAPLEPNRATRSPRCTASVTPSSTRRAPYACATPRYASITPLEQPELLRYRAQRIVFLIVGSDVLRATHDCQHFRIAEIEKGAANLRDERLFEIFANGPHVIEKWFRGIKDEGL